MTTRILLDTDIGDDVDDALALALACASPEIELAAVTTVFGDVESRSALARTILVCAGESCAAVPVAAGCGASLASRPLRGDDSRVPPQHVASLPESLLPRQDPRHGVDLIVDTVMAGDVVPVTIGALTNLAVALTMHRRLATKIPRVVAMAGELRSSMPEYNVRCDPEALAIVLGSGLPIDFTPYRIGMVAQLDGAEVDRLAASGRPLAVKLAECIEAWRQGDESRLPRLFDPMAIAGIVDDDLFEWRRGVVRVELRGTATYGYTTFVEDGSGPHRVAWDCDRDRCAAFLLDRVLAH